MLELNNSSWQNLLLTRVGFMGPKPETAAKGLEQRRARCYRCDQKSRMGRALHREQSLASPAHFYLGKAAWGILESV